MKKYKLIQRFGPGQKYSSDPDVLTLCLTLVVMDVTEVTNEPKTMWKQNGGHDFVVYKGNIVIYSSADTKSVQEKESIISVKYR